MKTHSLELRSLAGSIAAAGKCEPSGRLSRRFEVLDANRIREDANALAA